MVESGTDFSQVISAELSFFLVSDILHSRETEQKKQRNNADHHQHLDEAESSRLMCFSDDALDATIGGIF